MTRRVLFLCTGNSARSVLAEATLRAWGNGRYEAFSAGSHPTGRINPFAIAQLDREGFPTEGLRSKSWNEFATQGSTPMDLVVTVCDSAASETCPVVFGNFMRVHWGLFDPAGVEGSDDAKRQAFSDAHAIIRARVHAFLALPDTLWLDQATLKPALDAIAELP
jgi:arsenate reductase